MQRRIGRLKYMEELAYVPDMPGIFANVPMVPIKCDYDAAFGTFILTAISPMFDPVEEGEEIPEYLIKLRQTAGEPPEFDGLEKLVETGGLLPWEIPA